MRPLQQQGTCLGERYNIEEQIQFLYMLGQGAELGELEQVELDRLFITCYELTGKDGQELSEEAFWNMENEDVTVTLSEQHRSVLVQKRFRLKTGEYAKPKVLHLTGEAESSVYIHASVSMMSGKRQRHVLKINAIWNISAKNRLHR